MRRIIFRGMSVDNNEWVYGSLVLDSMSETRMSIIDWADMSEPNRGGGAYVWNDVVPESVGQYTGIIDSTGARIYEGDIIASPFVDENVFVEFDEVYAQFTYGGAEFGVESQPAEVLVLGNVYENPELLTRPLSENINS